MEPVFKKIAAKATALTAKFITENSYMSHLNRLKHTTKTMTISNIPVIIAKGTSKIADAGMIATNQYGECAQIWYIATANKAIAINHPVRYNLLCHFFGNFNLTG